MPKPVDAKSIDDTIQRLIYEQGVILPATPERLRRSGVAPAMIIALAGRKLVKPSPNDRKTPKADG